MDDDQVLLPVSVLAVAGHCCISQDRMAHDCTFCVSTISDHLLGSCAVYTPLCVSIPIPNTSGMRIDAVGGWLTRRQLLTVFPSLLSARSLPGDLDRRTRTCSTSLPSVRRCKYCPWIAKPLLRPQGASGLQLVHVTILSKLLMKR